MAASQLCIPYGAGVIGEAQLTQALVNGSAQGLNLNKLQQELVHGFFSECPLNEILACLKDSGASWATAYKLYQEAVQFGAYPNPQFDHILKEHLAHA